MIQCGHLVTSSLHALIMADAFEVPAAWLHDIEQFKSSKTEGQLKYLDYYKSTGREAHSVNSFATTTSAKPLSRLTLARMWLDLINAFPYRRVCAHANVTRARARLYAKVESYLEAHNLSLKDLETNLA